MPILYLSSDYVSDVAYRLYKKFGVIIILNNL